jgi:16S rRNA (adenine1518-N6/adenine1519-N6)-dimethyltransferase
MNPEVSKDQHFMENKKIIDRMVSLGSLKPGDSVLEIGPGTGILTKRIVGKGAKVTAVEKDRRFERILKKEFGKERNLELIFENALNVIEGMKFNKVISNLPYSICEPLINRLAGMSFEKAVLSIPEGFACILLAKPEEKGYSRLSLKSQIPRNAFRPEPKTESVVVVIKPLSRKDYKSYPEKFILKEIFLQDKKKLKNALMEGIINLNKRILGKNFTKNRARERIKKMDLDKRILEKKVSEMSVSDLEKVLKKITSFP